MSQSIAKTKHRFSTSGHGGSPWNIPTHIRSIMTITRREVQEMLSDWRIMVPIFLLTFILPLLLVGASSQMVRFVALEDEPLTERLVPFVILLVGFVPSSFSLITALESFVGERERNSLEALLAMPISDEDLYLGKLFSSFIPPLLSSYIAMLMFTFLLYAIDPALYFGGITVPRLSAIFLIVGLMALTMVSGAVVISSHISSIRAANLMSSFILVPMALIVQMTAFFMINDRWNLMWITTFALVIVATLLVSIGLKAFNREEILSREHQNESEIAFLSFFSRLAGKRTTTTRYYAYKNPILAIANREFRESITDWRILAPAFVLCFIIPLALVAGTDFAVDFLDDPRLVSRIVPFAVLLTGFVPATFSLIVALDSFVGERERNSLEALLSLPLTDTHLHASKIGSSLMPPLITSVIAMLLFSLAMGLFHPDLFFAEMNAPRLVLLMVMIGVMIIVMVAGSVIISSHTSSIRAANLLASFVLIPMAAIIQIQALFIIARRWDVMWIIVLALIVIAIALVRAGMKTFNREEILSREHEQINFHTISMTLGAFFREYHPAGISPDQYRGNKLSPSRFYRQELPALLHELHIPIVVACIAAIGGLFLGNYVANNIRFIGGLGEASQHLLDSVGQVPPPSFRLSLFVFANNMRVSILSNVMSAFSFGIFAFMVPLVAFTQIGFVAGVLELQGGSWFALGLHSPLQFVLGYVLPHGIIELPTFILSAALGLRIGASILCPPPGFSVVQNLLWALANFLKVWLLVLLPLVLLASLIEGLVSPLVIQALYQ